jgi:hypothetical protein
MAALSASRLVWAAMPPITPSTLPICWASSCISSTLAAARSTSSMRATTLAEADPTTLRELAA